MAFQTNPVDNFSVFHDSRNNASEENKIQIWSGDFLQDKSHESSISPMKVSCTVCHQTFCSYKTVEEHLRILHRRFICVVCDRTFSSHGTYTIHKQELHADQQDYGGFKCVCSHCGKRFSNRSRLALHENKHSEDRPFKCHICNKSYKHKNNLTAHLASVHEKKM